MSYRERETGTIVHRWPTDTSFSPRVIRMIADIAANSLTSFKERKERSQKYLDAFENARKEEKRLRLTHPSFSLEQRKSLHKLGYQFFRLRGNPLSDFYKTDERFGGEASMQTEVAVEGYANYLVGPGKKKFSRVLAAIDRFNKKIPREIPGVKAVIGRVSDYAELERHHQSYNFGKRLLYFPTYTLTPAGKGQVATIEAVYGQSFSLNVGSIEKNQSLESVSFMPLILPKSIGWDGPDYLLNH